jgi:hypothetical protein
MTMLTVVRAEPVNDSGTYYRLDENLELVACNRTEWEEFKKTGADTVATTQLGAFASVVTTFEGDDGFDDDDPHPFMTMTVIPERELSEAESHRSWHEAETAHRARVDELKALLESQRREREPQLDLL